MARNSGAPQAVGEVLVLEPTLARAEEWDALHLLRSDRLQAAPVQRRPPHKSSQQPRVAASWSSLRQHLLPTVAQARGVPMVDAARLGHNILSPSTS